MYLRFYIAPQTDAPHIYNHDVDENEIEAILKNPGENRPGREGSKDSYQSNPCWVLFTSDLCTRHQNPTACLLSPLTN